MSRTRAALGAVAVAAVAVAVVSGGSGADPRAPRFLAVAGIGSGGQTAVIDPLGNVVGWHRPGPEGRAAERWVERAQPLGSGAPAWAREMYRRSLLALRALTDWRSGAVIAGARQGWAYVWPRDAAAAALAFAAAGDLREAQRVARFLSQLDLDAAARFYRDGTPVPVREAQGDAAGWVAAAARAAGLPSSPGPGSEQQSRSAWRDRADYQEGSAGDYLANAIASTTFRCSFASYNKAKEQRNAITGDGQGCGGIRVLFGTPGGLVRRAGDPGSGLDSAVAWAVRPFPHPALFGLARRSLNRLVAHQTRFGIVPSEGWPGADPWTAPTAWTAWSLAALGERRQALRLMGDLRRAATPAGMLPERVDAHTGIPRSTTPLAWSHAFAILALRQLWP